jgi:hypothetical protein
MSPKRSPARTSLVTKGVVSDAVTRCPSDAYTGHAGVVAAFMAEAVATLSGRQIAEFVPSREAARVVPDCRFEASVN